MKDHMLALRSWCKTAAAKIKYPPDRDAVTEELYGHAMDRYDDLINSGVSADEALRQTLAAMGDAQQLAPELAAVHRPFWGYVEYSTRIIAIVLCVLLLMGAAADLISHGIDLFPDSSTEHKDNFTRMHENAHMRSLTDHDPNASTQVDGYTITIDRLSMWEWIEHPGQETTVLIRMEVQKPFSRTGKAPFASWLWAEDNLGNHYYSIHPHPEGTQSLSVYSRENSLFSSSCELLLILPSPAETEWIKLCYSRDGREFVIRLDLTEGGAA